MTLAGFLFGGVLVCYLVASVAYHAHLFAGSALARRVAPVALLMGLLLHALALAGRWVDPQASPMPPAVRVVSTVAWLLALTQLLLDCWGGWASVGALSVPLAFIAVLYANVAPHAPVTRDPVLKSALMRVHLTGVIVGFAGFALAFCLAVVYLAQSALLKRKQLKGALKRLPPLESSARAAHWLAAIGFWTLTIGIITGSVVAMKVSSSAWYLSPPFVTSAIAWLIYAVYIAASSLGGWRGRKTTYFLIGGFAALLVAALINVAGRSPWVR